MRKSIVISLVFALMLMTSCLDKEAVSVATNQLFSAVKDGNKSKIEAIYPESEDLPSYYKSDKIAIKEIKPLKHKEALVTVENEFTNGYGKTFTRDIKLYLKPDPSDSKKYVVYDSEGFCGWDPEENNEYKFALKTGCIDENQDVTDQQRTKRLEAAQAMLLEAFFEVYLDLKTKVTIKDWSWDTSYYGDSASGKGICVNNSTFSIPKPKYKIVYKDRNGNDITDDDGYITYDVLKPGQSKAFTFYTSYVGNATRASISVDFDEDMILEYIANKDYTGNEYAEFLAKKEEKGATLSQEDTTAVI
jgi:hypothetical protein